MKGPVLAALLLLSACTMVHRARTYPKSAEITNVGWYQPVETVVGGNGRELERATTKAEVIPADALAEVQSYAAAHQTSGLVVLHNGKIALEWYAEGASVGSRTNSMSMAKTLAALLLGLAIADGDIPSVDAPVADYLPRWRTDERRFITFENLLEMSSGLRKDERLELGSDLVRMHLGTHLPRATLRIPSVGKAGTTFEYNNADTQALALAIQEATGRRYAEYLSDRLWRPLGAADAAIWLDRPDGTPHAYCCFFARARDWARLGQMLLDEGMMDGRRVVPKDWILRMVLPSPANPDYGWQIWRAESGPGSTRAEDRSEPLLDRQMFWLDGKGTQRVYVMPSDHVVIVRVGEQPAEWDDAHLPNTVHRALAR